MTDENENTGAASTLNVTAGSDFAVFTYVEPLDGLGEPLLDQVTYWLPMDEAISYAKNNGGFVLSRFIPPQNKPISKTAQHEET